LIHFYKRDLILINCEMSPEPQLTGLAKTFNSVTFTGRANVAKATYASIILIVAAVKAKGYLTAK